ncbi:hypothetical protein AXE80_12995 [Wenyingzhuangia fucanilytica]|uniref:Sulfatase N-terminal domain-containing protein n=1 Tax=Wenyingzhuangia fucanilytica TaxID=1790137 RepID=A0A1B1Y8R0_9FLAO|nr:sulfatase-like hydrolase/transferase [Wenyingzhuangia fucanilytica]ANW97146.1 hypothetical protein AXE80_12995 [Wenyingzhuangia fucanilytica]
MKKLTTLAVFIIASLLCKNALAQGSAAQPNILFIAIDDLKPTLGCYGDTYAQTPEIDAIAANGTVFLNNQTQWSVCGPSRSSLLTGKRPDYTKVWNLSTLIRDIHPDIVTLPQYFKSKGYNVTGAGKIYDTRSVDSDSDAISWSTPFKKPSQLDYPSAWGQPAWGHYQTTEVKNNIAAYESSENGTSAAQSVYKPIYEIGVDDNGNSIPDNAYNDGAMADHAINLIDDFVAEPTKPFFLAAGFKNPHLPLTCPKKYYDLYDKNNAPLATYTGRGTDIPSLALSGSNEFTTYPTPGLSITKESDDSYTISEADQKTIIHAYYANVSYVDAQIGRIMDKLEEEGLKDKTIVIIWSDHGFHLGDHSMWAKHTNMENATVSPMIIYNPFAPSGNTTNTPTELLDIYPTLCDLTNQPIPSDMDGVSLKPLLTNPTTALKDFAVSQFKSNNKYGYSFKNERYRYTVWLNNGVLATDKPTSADYFTQELYDYDVDPNETTNYFNNPSYSAVQSDLVTKAQNYFDNGAGINDGTTTSNVDVVLNGDFEDTPFDSNWSFSNNGGSVASFTDAAADAYNGNSGAKIVVSTAGTGYNNVRLQNEKYTSDLTDKTITVTVNSKSVLGSEEFKIRMYHHTDGVNNYPTSDVFVPTTDTYKPYQYVFEVPDNTTEVRVDLLLGTQVGTYFFDDITTTVQDSGDLSSKRISNKNIVEVYPIPAQNEITINSPKNIQGVSIYNVYGQLIHQQGKIINNKIDLTNIGNGIYFLKIDFDDKTFTSQKIMISK